jgi:hypothetical protein
MLRMETYELAADDGIKQVIVIRKDLKMRRGKECAQAAHASMAFITRRLSFPGGLFPARDHLADDPVPQGDAAG